MKTTCLLRIIPLFLVSLFTIGCSSRVIDSSSNDDISSDDFSQSSQTPDSSSINQSFESIPLRYEISFKERNDIADNNRLLTGITYNCYIELDKDNILEGEPVFTYNHDLADIIVATAARDAMYRSFCLVIKDYESSSFELSIEWRTQKITKAYSIIQTTDLATCLYDYENDSNQKADYDDNTVIDSQEKYETLKSTLRNYVGGYQFPNVTFNDTFLLVRYFYVSGYTHYKYNQCFLYKEKVIIDYKEKYQEGDAFMVVSGVHFTLLQLPNEYKNYSSVTHLSPVIDLNNH